MVQRRPDLFTAFVGIGQVVSWRELVEAQYWYTLDRARAQPDPEAAKALVTMGSPPVDNHDEYMAMRQIMSQYLAASDRTWPPQAWSLIGAQLSAGDFSAYQKGLQAQAGLASAVTAMDTRAAGLTFTIPMFLVQGAEDHITDASTAIAYFDQIQAPVKHTTLIEGAGHFAMATHAAKVAEAIHQDLLLVPPLRK